MNRLVKLGAALGLLAATAVPATAMDLEFVIQNTGSDIISIVQVNGGDNLLDGEIEPGNSGTVYLTGLGDDDCDHTVSITTQNAAEFEVYTNLCEIDGMSVDDEEINVY